MVGECALLYVLLNQLIHLVKPLRMARHHNQPPLLSGPGIQYQLLFGCMRAAADNHTPLRLGQLPGDFRQIDQFTVACYLYIFGTQLL